MMRRMAGVVLALALVAVPAVAQGGPGRGEARGPRGGPRVMERNPAAFVLEHREQLQLTAEQVTRLETIRARVQQENGPRWTQLKEAFGDGAPADMTAEERQQLRARMQELRPVREEIRATNRKAGEEIHALLTDEQEAKLRPMMRRGDREGRPGRPGRNPGRRGPDGG